MFAPFVLGYIVIATLIGYVVIGVLLLVLGAWSASLPRGTAPRVTGAQRIAGGTLQANPHDLRVTNRFGTRGRI
jgi:hypothetical protein